MGLITLLMPGLFAFEENLNRLAPGRFQGVNQRVIQELPTQGQVNR